MKFKSLCDLILREATFGSPSDLYLKPKDLKQEHIIAAAIKDLETGDVYIGEDHTQAYDYAVSIKGNKIYNKCISGFYTSKDRFVDREEALKIAHQTEQIRSTVSYPSQIVRRRLKQLDSFDVIAPEY